MNFVKETAPHIRRKDAAWKMMLDVIIALLPTFIFALIIFPKNTIIYFVISAAIMVGSELVFIGLTHMMPKDGAKHSFKERFIYAYKGRVKLVNIISPLVTAMIYVLITPSGAPIFPVIVGAFAGIILGKLVFGGLGNNIFNPAAIGMCIAKVAFLDSYGTFLALPEWFAPNFVDMGGTPLASMYYWSYEAINQFNFLDMFLGKMQGTLGEVYSITILIGLVYLIIRRAIDIRIIVSFFGTFALMTLVAGLCIQSKMPSVMFYDFMIAQFLSGGLLFGGVFMLTDPVTGPITKPNRIIFGMIAAVITCLIRVVGALPEGMVMAIIIANMFVPLLDSPKFSNVKYSWKNLTAMAVIFVVPTLIMTLSLLFGGIVK